MAGLLAPPYGVMETGSNNDSKWSVSILHLRICFVVCVFMWQKKCVLYTSMTEEAPWLCCVSQTGSSHCRACTCGLCSVLWGLHSGEWPALVQAGTSILDIRMLGAFCALFRTGFPSYACLSHMGSPGTPYLFTLALSTKGRSRTHQFFLNGPSNPRLLVGARCCVLSHTGRS